MESISSMDAFKKYCELYKARQQANYDRPAPSCKELGEALGVSKAAGKNWIDKLIEKKFIIHDEVAAWRATRPAGEPQG